MFFVQWRTFGNYGNYALIVHVHRGVKPGNVVCTKDICQVHKVSRAERRGNITAPDYVTILLAVLCTVVGDPSTAWQACEETIESPSVHSIFSRPDTSAALEQHITHLSPS